MHHRLTAAPSTEGPDLRVEDASQAISIAGFRGPDVAIEHLVARGAGFTLKPLARHHQLPRRVADVALGSTACSLGTGFLAFALVLS